MLDTTDGPGVIRRTRGQARFAADPTHERFESAEAKVRPRCSIDRRAVFAARIQIRQPRLEAVNAGLSVANVVVELLRTKNVHEASVLRFGSGGAPGAAC